MKRGNGSILPILSRFKPKILHGLSILLIFGNSIFLPAHQGSLTLFWSQSCKFLLDKVNTEADVESQTQKASAIMKA
jgi:hypothetical protein